MVRPVRPLVSALLAALLACAGASAVPSANGLYATFETSLGTFTARLHYDLAPLTVANFVGLAEGTRTFVDPRDGVAKRARYYDGLIFHRVVPNFVIQGGDPLGTGTGGPGYTFADEFGAGLSHNRAGILSMAKPGDPVTGEPYPATNGSQFFITTNASVYPTSLDGKHSIFGEVVENLAVVNTIVAVPTGASNRPLTPVTINRVVITRVGPAAAAFNPAAQPLPVVEDARLRLDLGAGRLSFARPASSVLTLQRAGFAKGPWSALGSYWDFRDGPATDLDVATHTTGAAQFFRGARVRYQYLPPTTAVGSRYTLTFQSGYIAGTVFEFTLSGASTGTWRAGANSEIFAQAGPISSYVWSYNNVLGSLFHQALTINGSTSFLYAGYYLMRYTGPTSGTFTGVIVREDENLPPEQRLPNVAASGTFTAVIP